MIDYTAPVLLLCYYILCNKNEEEKSLDLNPQKLKGGVHQNLCYNRLHVALATRESQTRKAQRVTIVASGGEAWMRGDKNFHFW